jgi:indole-3-glycerol phosphate synthase/phosphoribosylanthranilate isomerase
VPADRVLVAESGIADRADVERLACHADAFLVGSSLMKAPRPAEAARALAFGRVKVCGLTSPQDIACAAAAGATHAGFIMVPGTPRAVTLSQARPLAEQAREQGAATVGIFRNEKLMQVAQAVLELPLDAVQLHGEEDVGYINALRNMIPQHVEIWAASGVAETIQPRSGADRLLFDTIKDGRSGGTGTLFDWTRISDRGELGQSLLAGGLSPANARAASKLGAYALDVGSGVEAEPGRKDPAKLSAFFEALRTPARGDAECA